MAAFESRVKHDFKMIEDAFQFFHMDTHRYPNSIEELMTSDAEGWNGPYLAKPALDPWDRLYIYEYTGESPKPYIIKTLGADGRVGGTGENTDCSNLDPLPVQGDRRWGCNLQR